jgi:hypothetical protein
MNIRLFLMAVFVIKKSPYRKAEGGLSLKINRKLALYRV